MNFACLPHVTIHLDFRDLDEVGETHTGHVELKIGSGRG